STGNTRIAMPRYCRDSGSSVTCDLGYKSWHWPRGTAFPVPRVDHAHDQHSFVLPLGNSTRCRSTLPLFLYHPYWPGATLHHDGSGGAGALGDTCGIITPCSVVPVGRCGEGDASMYTTILLAAALQDWERYSPHALAARAVAATLAKGAAQPLHILSVYDYPPVETTDLPLELASRHREELLWRTDALMVDKLEAYV